MVADTYNLSSGEEKARAQGQPRLHVTWVHQKQSEKEAKEVGEEENHSYEHSYIMAVVRRSDYEVEGSVLQAGPHIPVCPSLLY